VRTATDKRHFQENRKLIDFNHIDFLWGQRASGEVYYPMLEVMQKDLAKRAAEAI
jgi:hypothetical protein